MALKVAAEHRTEHQNIYLGIRRRHRLFLSSSSQNTVAQHATNLLSDITDLLEDNAYNLPVIFVVHSLGGIVVKAARMSVLPYP